MRKIMVYVLRHIIVFPAFWVLAFAIASYVYLPFAGVSPKTFLLLKQIAKTTMTLSGTWLLSRIVSALKGAFLSGCDITTANNLRQRSLLTQVQFLEKFALICIWTIGLSATLMTFEGARRLGFNLIASAGVAGIVLGFAAQKTIANFLAGFQIAFTQPIRIDDVVVVEKEWGRVEDITLTYVVIRLWDLRRLVVPITYFVEKPFENWTRKSADVLTHATVYADYTIPVDTVREEFHRILGSTPLWDGKVASMQVTNWTDKAIEIRALMSASDSGRAFDLKCLVRERLIAYMQNHFPNCLPQNRIVSTQ